MVTARVPIEIKEQVNALLKENGSTPTELVNSAYEYYLEYQQLPKTNMLLAGERRLTPEQSEQVRDALAQMAAAGSKGGRR